MTTATNIQTLTEDNGHYELGEDIAKSIFTEDADRTEDVNGESHVTTEDWCVEEWMQDNGYQRADGFAGWGEVWRNEDGELLAVSTYEIEEDED